MKINTLTLFPIKIGRYDLSEIVSKIDLNRVLTEEVEINNSLVEGSRLNFQPHTSTEYINVFKAIDECIKDFSSELCLKQTYVYESWINVLRKQGSVGSHRHYGGVISGALYLVGENESSYLYFVNPTEGYRMTEMQYVNSYDCDYTPNVYPVIPKTGHLILFPSWIEHYVGVNNSNLRVTLSFNTK